MGGAGEAGGSNLNSCGDLLADCLRSRDITQLRISATYSSSAKKHPDLDICYLHLKLVGEPLNLIQEYLEIFILFNWEGSCAESMHGQPMVYTNHISTIIIAKPLFSSSHLTHLPAFTTTTPRWAAGWVGCKIKEGVEKKEQLCG